MIPTAKVTKPWALTAAGLMITLGSALLFLWPWIYNLSMNMALSMYSGPTFNVWRKNPIPLYLEFFLFNWTNPDDIYKRGVKPHFKEIGPFVFEEVKEKVNITWNSNNTVTFSQMHHYYFREEMSVAGLNTKITTLNSIAATAAYIIRDWNFIARKGFDWSLRTVAQRIHTTRTVGEFIFFGYEDPFISIARSIPKFHGIDFPDWDKFAWFYQRNASSQTDGVFNMVASGDHVGEMRNWNYKPTIELYDGECDKVKGSAGELYGPHKRKDEIGFFSTDICRYVGLDYAREDVVDGTLGYRYELGDGFFGFKDKNYCYLDSAPEPIYGIVNVSTCKYGAPGFVSHPHFYGADPYFIESVDGMEPDRKKHQMFMTIEPTTGIPLQVEARLQLNVLIEPLDYITMFQDLPREYYIPILWLQEMATMPPDLHFYLKLFLMSPTVLKCTGAILLIGGIPMFTLFLYKPILSRLRLRTTRRKNVTITFNDCPESGVPLMDKITPSDDKCDNAIKLTV